MQNDKVIETVSESIRTEIDHQTLAGLYHAQIPKKLVFQLRLSGYVYGGIRIVDYNDEITRWEKYYPEHRIGVSGSGLYYIIEEDHGR